MSVILLGYRGSGKTTVGKKLADRLWLKFVDTDDLVTSTATKTIREIFERDGEEQFRSVEETAVKDALARPDHVIALGGGAVLSESNRAMIKSFGGARIYLRCEPKELHRRIHADPATAANRPPLSKLGGDLDEIEQMLAMRESLYRDVMTKELDVTNLSADEAVVYLTRMI